MSEEHLKPVSKMAQLLLGGLVGFVSLFFGVFGFWGFWTTVTQADARVSIQVVSIAFLVVGLGTGLLAYRLISGKGRKQDGGLFSPWALRIAALFFALGPLVSIFTHPWHVLLILIHLGAAGACLELARRREAYLRPDGTTGGPA